MHRAVDQDTVYDIKERDSVLLFSGVRKQFIAIINAIHSESSVFVFKNYSNQTLCGARNDLVKQMDILCV